MSSLYTVLSLMVCPDLVLPGERLLNATKPSYTCGCSHGNPRRSEEQQFVPYVGTLLTSTNLHGE